MTRHFSVFVAIASILSLSACAGRGSGTALANDLKEVGTPDSVMPIWMNGQDGYLKFESEQVSFGGQGVRVRIWCSEEQRWPGQNRQVIHILSGNEVTETKVVGGSPIMLKAWIAQYHQRLFIYIKCKHRFGSSNDSSNVHASPDGTYIYEVNKDFSIAPQGIHFDPKDIIRKEKEHQAALKKLGIEVPNESPNKDAQEPAKAGPGK